VSKTDVTTPLSKKEAAARERDRRQARRRLWKGAQKFGLVFGIAALAVILVYSYQAAGANRASSSPDLVSKTAPEFTLTSLDGRQVSLSEFSGKKNVLLFFNEGYGCAPCWQQTAALQEDLDSFKAMDTEVFAVMVDPPALLSREAPRWGLRALPILVDQSTSVSKSYDALGGMHANKPDHKFVLISKDGLILWAADYPSMWVDRQVVVKQVQTLLQQ
jgi:peroxiredoxin